MAKNKTTFLEQRIKEFNIPRWPYQPAFDRVVVYRLPEEKAARETYAKDGVIVKPDTIKAHEKNESPRGVLCAAGIQAMDYLRSNLISVGDIVWVARFSPWQHEVERDSSGNVSFMFLRASDIVGSEDVLARLKGKAAAVTVGDDGRHMYTAENGALPRFDPPEFADT